MTSGFPDSSSLSPKINQEVLQWRENLVDLAESSLNVGNYVWGFRPLHSSKKSRRSQAWECGQVQETLRK